MSNDDYLAGLVAEVSQALEPITGAVQSSARMAALLRDLGWELDEEGNFTAVQDAFADVASAVSGLAAAVAARAEMPELVAAVGRVAAALIGAGTSVAEDLPAPLDQPAFWQSLPDDLLELLLFEHLDRRHPLAFGLLAAVGIVRLDPHPADDASGRMAFDRRTFDAERVLPALTAPGEVLPDVYGWGGALNHRALTWASAALLRGLRAASDQGAPRDRLLNAYYDELSEYRGEIEQVGASAPPLFAPGVDAFARAALLVVPVPPAGDKAAAPSGLLLVPVLTGQAAGAFDLGGGATLTVETAIVGDQLHVAVRPEGTELIVSSEAPQLDFSARLDVHRDPGLVIAGDPASTRLELWAAHLALGVAGPVNAVEVTIEAVLDQLRLTIVPGEGDGFLQRVMGSDPVQVDVGPGVTWSNNQGLRLAGGSSLDIELPLAINAGVIALTGLRIRGAPSDDGAGALELSISGSLMLGPVSAVVRNVGVIATARNADAAQPGNLGIVDVGFGFKPPEGVGLSIDAVAVTGGGYVSFDLANEQYAGLLQLEIKGGISIKAVGLLTTRMPDGSKGFSLLLIITGEFPPIQLGYGFTLNGVGGLIGVNRTMVLEALRAGVKNRALDSILFPKDPVKNAPQIISDLRNFFPPTPGQYVIGPMAKLAWGAPKPVLTVDLGIVLEFPSPVRLAIMGRLRMVLPEEKIALVSLQMDILGTIEFEKGDASVDATLVESRVATFPITGDMAMRTNWGASPAFALAAGGFNPRFQPPPNFPALGRLAIALAAGDNPRLRLEAYLALTSNTAQIGARLDLYAAKDAGAAGVFSVEAYLGFDTLFQFSPFAFVVDVGAAATVKRDGKSLFAVQVGMTLTGPQPMHAWGKATFEFLGKREIPFDVTIGEQEPQPALPPGDPLSELLSELVEKRNWSAQLPADGHSLVTLRGDLPTNDVLVHPLGALTVRQRAVPLEVEISKYGNTAPAAERRFAITRVWFGSESGSRPTTPVSDHFAPGQFFDMSDDEKLSRPAFETFRSGVNFGTAGFGHGTAVASTFDYDTVVIDKEEKVRRPTTTYQMAQDVVALADLGAAARSPMLATGSAKYAGPPRQVVVEEPGYAVVGTDDLRVPAGEGFTRPTGGSYTEAEEARRKNSAARGPVDSQLQVVGGHEVRS
jgi:hypothetical protein